MSMYQLASNRRTSASSDSSGRNVQPPSTAVHTTTRDTAYHPARRPNVRRSGRGNADRSATVSSTVGAISVSVIAEPHVVRPRDAQAAGGVGAASHDGEPPERVLDDAELTRRQVGEAVDAAHLGLSLRGHHAHRSTVIQAGCVQIIGSDGKLDVAIMVDVAH